MADALLEIRNRADRNIHSTGYVIRFKQLDALAVTYDERTIQYTYDALSRLLSAEYIGTSKRFDYTFDLAGNRISETIDSGTPTTYSYNAANQITNTGFVYDANGNLTSDGTNSYAWDRANRLLSMGGVDYAYDGDGRRISQTANAIATRYLLDIQPSLANVLGQTVETETSYFIHASRSIHAMQTPSGGWSYASQDGLGSVRQEVDAVGTVLATGDYQPFGTLENVQGTFGLPFKFTGEQTDSNALVHLRNRYLNPILGVFPSLDPFEGVINRPMSLNGYSWVEGNPVMNTDPTGMILENPYAWDTCQGTPVAQSNTVVHIPCGQRARVRSHPSTLGQHLGTALAGQQFTALRERADSPTNQDLAPSSWVEIEFGGTTGWIRRSDGFNINVANGPAPTGCDSISPLDTPDRPVFSYGTPENTRGGTNVAECFNGTQPATRETPEGSVPACSRERVVAFVIACESGAEQYPDGSAEQKQVMADIAHVIRNRMRAGSFPDSAFDVVRQSRQFQCFTEGSGANLDIAMGQIQRTAEALVYSGDNAVLPPASIPDLDLALFFFGVGLSPDTRSNAAPNSIERENMTLFLTSNNFVGVDQSTLLGQSGNGIYLGHGPFSSAAFGTVFFSDDPRFTGNF